MKKKKSKKTIEREKHKEWREKILERDDYKCQICKRITGVLNAHHIIPKQFKEFKYDVQNGICLCFQHHRVGKYSPHQNALFFSLWLQVVKPKQYDYVLNKVDEICTKWNIKD